MLAAPAAPYRGIRPFRYADHAVFFARERETRLLASLVDVYRGVFLYGDSGNGKSSLVNAGLLPQTRELGFEPVRVRVQPRSSEELVIEQITVSDDDTGVLPCVLAPQSDGSARVVLSIADFEERVRVAATEHHPLIIFDQFEEILTLFDDVPQSRRDLAQMIVRLLRDALPVKLLFAFREDYLGKVKQLLAACPELVDQALRLGPPSAGWAKRGCRLRRWLRPAGGGRNGHLRHRGRGATIGHRFTGTGWASPNRPPLLRFVRSTTQGRARRRRLTSSRNVPAGGESLKAAHVSRLWGVPQPREPDAARQGRQDHRGRAGAGSGQASA